MFFRVQPRVQLGSDNGCYPVLLQVAIVAIFSIKSISCSYHWLRLFLADNGGQLTPPPPFSMSNYLKNKDFLAVYYRLGYNLGYNLAGAMGSFHAPDCECSGAPHTLA